MKYNEADGYVLHDEFLRVIKYLDEDNNMDVVTTTANITSITQRFSFDYLEKNNAQIITKETHPEYWL